MERGSTERSKQAPAAASEGRREPPRSGGPSAQRGGEGKEAPLSEVRKRLRPQARAGGNRREAAARARSEVENGKRLHRAK